MVAVRHYPGEEPKQPSSEFPTMKCDAEFESHVGVDPNSPNGSEVTSIPHRASEDAQHEDFPSESRNRSRESVLAVAQNIKAKTRRSLLPGDPSLYGLANMFASRDPEEAGDESEAVSAYGARISLQHASEARKCLRRIVKHKLFDAYVGIVVLINSVMIAIEQTERLQGGDMPAMKAVETGFLCFYCGEIILRFLVDGVKILRDKWVQFDIFIVTVSIMTDHILSPEQLETLGPLQLVRLARLARLLRTARLLILLRELWLLVHGLMASAGIMLYTMALIAIILYAFALLGVELITLRHANSDDPVIEAIVETHFPSLEITAITLLQFVTLDSCAAIYAPLIKHDWYLAPYFLSMILVNGIVLMNLITAVVVNSALEQAQQNKEAEKILEERKKKKFLKELRHFFCTLDKDLSGKVDLNEIMMCTDEDLAFVKQFIRGPDLIEVFCHLDVDGDGELDIDEFCEGLYQAIVSQTPIEFKRMDKRLDHITHTLHDLVHSTQQVMVTCRDTNEVCTEAYRSTAMATDAPAFVPTTKDPWSADAVETVPRKIMTANRSEEVLRAPSGHANGLAKAPKWDMILASEIRKLRRDLLHPPALDVLTTVIHTDDVADEPSDRAASRSPRSMSPGRSKRKSGSGSPRIKGHSGAASKRVSWEDGDENSHPTRTSAKSGIAPHSTVETQPRS